MEFPKETLKNSSPILLPPLSDYACVNQLFTFDFGVTDPDGDDLVYRLVTPLDAPSSTTPKATIAPFDLVNFSTGFSASNMIGGSLPLSIDSEGILSVNANMVGLYVFAVAIDEYRDGVKIGQITREFQLKVLDCEQADPPELEISINGITYNETDTLTFDYFDNNKCADIEINDLQTDGSGVVTIKARNWDGAGITFDDPNWTGSNDFVEICFPDCPLPNGEPYIFDVIVSDNSCAVPLRDTVKMHVLIDYPNIAPELTASLNLTANIHNVELLTGESLSFEISASDADADSIEIEIITIGFDANSLGMDFTVPAKGLSILTSTFTWTPDCDAIPIDKDSIEYQDKFVVRDYK